jgi:hypothetical protein
MIDHPSGPVPGVCLTALCNGLYRLRDSYIVLRRATAYDIWEGWPEVISGTLGKRDPGVVRGRSGE